MPLDFENSRGIFVAMVEILSISEFKDLLETHIKEILDEIYL